MRLCIRVLTFLLAIIAVSMLIPIACALALGERQVIRAFALPAIFFFALPFACYPLTRQKNREQKKQQRTNISLKGGYVLVSLCYIAACFAGAVPLVLSGAAATIPDALFESVSGFSTTGATVLLNIDALPMSINVWRCELHWLGGMGIIALTVALLPLLGIGGFQLYKAETTGPEKGKITPRIAATAKILWLIYLTFTVCGTFSLMLCGMNFFDALAHSFSILGAGGFSTHASSLAFFDSRSINLVCAALMFLTGVNYTLYYYALSARIREIRDNTELKVYVAVVIAATLVLCAILFPQYFSIQAPLIPSLFDLLESGFFHVVSILTTTGLTFSAYENHGSAVGIVVLLLLCIGGCSGSAAGGVKIVRWLIIVKRTLNNIKRMLHPHGVFSMRLNRRPARKDATYSALSFLAVYFLLALVTAFVAAVDGADVVTALSAGVSLTGNTGIALGTIGHSGSYSAFSGGAKLFFCITMLAGRLEIYPILLLFLPSFWRKRA